jgi:hypothetical protein
MYGIRYVSCGDQYEHRHTFPTYQEAETEAVWLRGFSFVGAIEIFKL